MPAVSAVGTAVLFLTGALLCACAAPIAGSPDNLVAVTETVHAAATSAPPASTRTTASDVRGSHGDGSSIPAINPANKVLSELIQVSKCYTNATTGGGGEMLIKARSSDPTARLFAYRADGTLIGELQNGGGSRYGGSVMPYQRRDPVMVTIKSSTGATMTVPTTPFRPGN